jgi:hypothetical protein
VGAVDGGVVVTRTAKPVRAYYVTAPDGTVIAMRSARRYSHACLTLGRHGWGASFHVTEAAAVAASTVGIVKAVAS